MSKRPPLLSFSALDTFEQCGWKYHLKYQDRIKPYQPIRYSLVTGVAFHALVDQMYKVRDFDIKFLTRNWKQYFMDALETEASSFAPITGFEKQLNYGYGLIKKFHTFADEQGYLVDPIETEWTHKETFHGTKVMVKVDLIIKRADNYFVEVIDFKTGWKLPSQEDVDKSKQLTLYDFMVRRVLGLRDTQVGLFYPRRSKVLLGKRNPEDFKSIYIDLFNLNKSIQTNNLEPNFESCPKCEFKDYCKFFKKDVAKS